MTSAASHSLKFQVWIVHQQLQSNANANYDRRSWNSFMWFVVFVKVPSSSCTSAVWVTVKRLDELVQKMLKLHYVIRYISLQILYITFVEVIKSNSPHHEIFSILVRNTLRDMLICTCLLNFPGNRAPLFVSLCW